MKTEVEYHLTYTKKPYKGAQPERVVKIRPTLQRINAELDEVIKWGQRVPEMELTIVSIVKRTYIEELLHPAAP